MQELVARLGTLEVFEQLTLKEREQLAQWATPRTFRKGEIVCHQEEVWPFVLYLADGALRSVIHSPEGRNYVVAVWEAGEVFWAHTVLDDEPMPSTLEAVSSAQIYQWRGDVALDAVLRNTAAARALLRRQTQLIRKRRASIFNLAFNPVASRLAKLILDKFRAVAEPTLPRDLTLAEMAEMVASSPEVVCRVLYQFQATGWLSIERASITLHDQAALAGVIQHD
jgi:CRP-like cAMP-binding protein